MRVRHKGKARRLFVVRGWCAMAGQRGTGRGTAVFARSPATWSTRGTCTGMSPSPALIETLDST